MCTAATYKTADFYFGRTLDYEFSYGDEVTVTPRNYPLTFRHASAVSTHYAIIGMAHVAGDYPLYYDAFNEKGLCMAGLNFVGNASYQKPQEDHDNIAQFEFIPWILSQCASVKEARVHLAQMVLTDTPFNEQFAPAQLHWILADKNECIVIEPMADAYLRQSGGCPDKQSTIPAAVVLPQQLHEPVPEAAAEYIFCRSAAYNLQPRHGRSRTSGRPLLRFPVCTGRFYKIKCPLRRIRTRKCQPVFPYPRFG